MIKRISLFLLMLFLGISSSNSETSVFSFLRYNSGARAAALAGSFEAAINDPSAVFYNPATISTVTDKKFSTTFLKHILDINSGNVSFIREFEDLGVIGASVIYTNYGSFESADRFGKRTGTFGANDIAMAVSFSNELDSNLYYGASLKFIFENLEKNSSFAMGIDAGLLYRLADKRTNLGISILHAGTQITTFSGSTERMPLDIRIGGNHRLRGLPLLFNFSFHHLADTYNNFFDKFMNFSVGGELYLGEFVMLRLGFDNNIRRLTTPSSEKKLSGLSAGLGIKTKDINLDYGIAQVGSTALLHRFSIMFDL